MNQPPNPLRWKMAAASVLSLFAMSYVDYVTGYELIFSAAYLIPVSLCAWYFERRAILAMSLASGLASWYVDRLSGHAYEHSLVQYGNGFMCFLISLVTGLLLHRLKNTLQERSRMNRDLHKALADLKRSTEEIRQLQNGLQVVCAWTKRIKVGEEWMAAEEFLSKQLHLKLTHGMSPEACREFEREVEQRAREEGAVSS